MLGESPHWKSRLAEIGVEMRAGVHFGEVERRADGAVSGVSVHIGARVMALANAGEVLISRTVRDILLGSRFCFDERGTSELKGIPGQWTVYLATEQKERHGTQPGAPANVLASRVRG